jgi:hypothetical protein
MVSVVVVSTVDHMPDAAFIDSMKQQRFLHGVELVVGRGERSASLTQKLEQAGYTSVYADEGSLVVRSMLDRTVEACRGEIVILVAPDLVPQGDGWVNALAGPLLADPRSIVLRGLVRPEPGLSPYDAYRFEQATIDPLDFIAFRKSVWEKHPFKKSGDLGIRWLERLKDEGQLRSTEEAVATGKLSIPGEFTTIVRATFCNLPETLPEAVKRGVRETLADWDALRRRGLESPAAVYTTALKVRMAEMVGRTRWKTAFGQPIRHITRP